MKINKDSISGFMMEASEVAKYLRVTDKDLEKHGTLWGLGFWDEVKGRGKLYYPEQVEHFRSKRLQDRPLITASELATACDPVNNL